MNALLGALNALMAALLIENYASDHWKASLAIGVVNAFCAFFLGIRAGRAA